MFQPATSDHRPTARPGRCAFAFALATAALAATVPAPGSAQLDPSDPWTAAYLDVAAGDQVRLRLQDGSTLEGSVRAREPESLQIMSADVGLLRVDPNEIETLDRLEGRRYWLEGALLGGAVTGLVLGTALAGSDDGFLDFGFEDGLAAGFVLGAPLGLLVGGLTKGTRWAPVIRPSTPVRTREDDLARQIEVGVRWSPDLLGGG